MNFDFCAGQLRRSTLALALGLTFASTSAIAQSNITGAIFGQVTDHPGATVVIENVDTGMTRTTTVDTTGRYRFSSLNNGRYKVTLQNNGAEISARDNVMVKIASGTEVSFGGATSAALDLEGVSVNASALPSIDVSSIDTRTVLTAEQLRKLPMGQDVAAAAMLAPGVVGNSSYGVPSFGGAASSENAYLINGYAVTNPLTSIGFSTLPFDAIDQEQVLTGGYGAEFGRSTGGVINIVTKRGSNEWKGGVYAMWRPEALRANPRNNYFPNTGAYGPSNPDPRASSHTDGTLYQYRNKNQSSYLTTGAYVGDELIKDRLFFYIDAEMSRQDGNSVASYSNSSATVAATGWNDLSYKIPRWAAKIDWNISDNHIIELTGVSDKTQYDSSRYGFDYDDYSHDDVQNGGVYTKDSSQLWVGKYTGYLTEDLIVSALYGTQKADHVSTPWHYDPSCPYISSSATNQAPGLIYNSCQKASPSLLYPGANDKTAGWRLDVEYHVGDHDIRIGYDRQDATSFTGTKYPGDYGWMYGWQKDATVAIDAGHGVSSPASAGGLGSQGYYVYRYYNTRSSEVKTEQAAQFIEDRWQLTDRWLLSLGLRNEQFTNLNGEGQPYARQRHQLAPRLGVTWDVNGDSSLKLFANAGRYHLAMPNNVAIRGASGSLISSEYFTYTGVDPVTGAPTGLSSIAVDASKGYTCSGNAISTNLECGETPDPRTVAAKGMKAHYQDEFLVGMEQQLSAEFNWGAKVTYRTLRSAIDDTCTPALGGRCFLFNPGQGNSFQIEQPDGSFETVHYSKAELLMPDLKRKYYALDLFLEHAFSNKWYGRIDYTFSRNYGNTEGQLASDLDTGSGGQSDVSTTQDWDLPQIMVGANGLLPNNRTHQLKAFGYYQMTDEWRVGANVLIASGRPKTCTSFYPTADKGLYNGSYYYFCGLAGSGTQPGSVDADGKPNYAAPSDDYRFSPRGQSGETPYTYQLNLNVAYTPKWMDNKLTLQVDVINVLNSQIATTYNNRYSSNRTTMNPLYGRELNYTDPRYFRLTARYDF